MAGVTEGLSFVNQSNLDFAVNQTVEVNGSFYRLGYFRETISP